MTSIVFLQLPITRPVVQFWWERAVAMNLQMWPGPNAFVIALACLLVIVIGSWRALSPTQAKLYLKSFYVIEHFRELRSVLVRSGRLHDSPKRVALPKKPVVAIPVKEK